MKKAQYYEEAKRLYVSEGFNIDTIVTLLKNNVSRKTIFNWKVEHDWDGQRTQFMEASDDIQKELLLLTKQAIQQAKADPSSYNIFAVVKALSALKMVKAIDLKAFGLLDKALILLPFEKTI